MYHHKRIKRFHVAGVIYSDDVIPRLKTEYIRLLVESMRASGYVARIDIAPDFTIEYNGESYNFELSVYGTHVGKKRAKCIKYLDGNKPHMMETMLPQSLIPQE